MFITNVVVDANGGAWDWYPRCTPWSYYVNVKLQKTSNIMIWRRKLILVLQLTYSYRDNCICDCYHYWLILLGREGDHNFFYWICMRWMKWGDATTVFVIVGYWMSCGDIFPWLIMFALVHYGCWIVCSHKRVMGINCCGHGDVFPNTEY